jgi:hypothetical protein
MFRSMNQLEYVRVSGQAPSLLLVLVTLSEYTRLSYLSSQHNGLILD